MEKLEYQSLGPLRRDQLDKLVDRGWKLQEVKEKPYHRPGWRVGRVFRYLFKK